MRRRRGDKPNRDFVIGKWGTDGDCTLAIDLRPDGTSDGPFGNWTYNDGVLSFPDDPEFKINVTVIDPNTMESTNGSGKTAKMTRCPGRGRRPYCGTLMLFGTLHATVLSPPVQRSIRQSGPSSPGGRRRCG